MQVRGEVRVQIRVIVRVRVMNIYLPRHTCICIRHVLATYICNSKKV